MRHDLLEIVCCPVHKSRLDLRVSKEQDGEVLEGVLHCKQCSFDYPIEEGIANLLPPELHEGVD